MLHILPPGGNPGGRETPGETQETQETQETSRWSMCLRALLVGYLNMVPGGGSTDDEMGLRFRRDVEEQEKSRRGGEGREREREFLFPFDALNFN